MPDPQGSLPTSVTDPSGAVLYSHQRDNPEDMFTPEQNLARNKAWAKPGPYNTSLPPQQEQQFQGWVKNNNVNWNNDDQSYDMRGFWKAQQAGDPRAKSSIDPNDGRLHFPDLWKTPYEATFSNESMYAQPNAPRWVNQGGDNWSYQLPNGHVIYDDVSGRWHGLPPSGIGNILRGAGTAIAGDIMDLAHGIWEAGPGTMGKVWSGQLQPGTPEATDAALGTSLTMAFSGAPEGALRTGLGPLWHGAARELEGGRFSPMRIGSGEGYHGEGYGAYVSEAQKVAEWYQREYGEFPKEISDLARRHLAEEYPAGARWSTSTGLSHTFTGEPQDYAAMVKKLDLDPSKPRSWVLAAARLADFEAPSPGGALYQLKYPGAEVEHFLRWDKPLKEQSDYVKQRLRRLGIDENATVPKGWEPHGYERGPRRGNKMGDMDGNNLYSYLGTKYGNWQTKEGVNPSGDPKTAAVMRLVGIRGTRYPSGGMSGRQGAFNYSVFSPEALDVIKKYGIGALLIGGGTAATGAGDRE